MNRIGSLFTLGATALGMFAAGCSDAPVASGPETAPMGKLRSVPAGLSAVPGSYIVVFNESVSDAEGATRGIERALGIQADNTYEHAIKGFSAHVAPGLLRQLEDDDRIAYIEPDIIVSIDAQTLPWGINNVDADVSSTLAGNGSGSVTGVEAYVIDTGVDLDHPDLNVIGGVDYYAKRGGTGDDNNGHGTHVAGTIGARDNDLDVVGVAPGVPIFSVKVLSANGSGSTSGIVKGIDFVTARKKARPTMPMVANMSLGAYVGTTAYGAMDNAVKNAISWGVFFSVAAGNSSANASLYSPAHTVEAATVGSFTSTNSWSSFSNYGAIVDMNAPGSSILSTKRGGGTTTMSGTSMAAPHVAGAAALYASNNPTASPATILAAIVAASNGNATSRVTSVPAGTTTLALYTGGF